MTTEREAESFILLKALSKGYVGGKHTNRRNISKGAPPKDHKFIDDVLDKLIKKGWFIQKPKSDGIHISLSPRMLKSVHDRLRELDEIS